MKTFDGNYVPERGDIICHKSFDYIYVLVLGARKDGTVFGYTIFKSDSFDTKDYKEYMIKASLDYCLSHALNTNKIMRVNHSLPTSSVYNFYKGTKDSFITSVGKSVVDVWITKSKLQGVTGLDYDYSLYDILSEYRQTEQNKLQMNCSFDLYPINSKYYALVVGTYGEKTLYIRFRASQRFLEKPDDAVKDRMSSIDTKIHASAIKNVGRSIVLADSTKNIVKENLKKRGLYV